jgi:hypothetical protein
VRSHDEKLHLRIDERVEEVEEILIEACLEAHGPLRRMIRPGISARR